MCPVCSYKKNKTIKSYHSYKLVECLNCTLQFIHPFPNKKTLESIYKKEYFFGDLTGAQGYKNYNTLKSDLDKEAEKKLDLIKKHTTRRILLDVGAGTGFFLESAKKRGYLTHGNDISLYAIEEMKRKKIKTYNGALTNAVIPTDTFEIITGWDFIEHVPNIREVMKTIHSALKKNGYAFFTTPSRDSIDGHILKQLWYGYKKVPEHLLYFNRKSLTLLFEKEDFSIVTIMPWGFYRSIGFIAQKLQLYSPIFSFLTPLVNVTRIQKLTLFFPFTDCLIIVKKT